MNNSITRIHTSPSSPQDARGLEQRRYAAVTLFEHQVRQAEVARRLTVTRAAVHYWYTTWRKKGKEGLAAKKSGRKSHISESQWRRIERNLLTGPQAAGYATDLWTLERISTLIRKVAHVHYQTKSAVWKLLSRMRWSCQKPERRSRERDEEAIAHWKRTTWPAIQKKG